MVKKTSVKRIGDAQACLQNTLVVSAPERAAADQLVQAFLTAAYPLGALSAGYPALSTSLSLGKHVFEDPRRDMARALFLLWSAIKYFDANFNFPQSQIGQISLATVGLRLASYIHKACCVLDQVNGGHAGTDLALAALSNNPLAFLRMNKVLVRGSGAYNLLAAQNIQACQFFYDPQYDRFVFAVAGGIFPAHARPIQVESVTAFHWTDPRYVPPLIPVAPHDIATTNFNNLTGIELSGAHIMVTTQFTGCAFSMAEHAGSMYCAHVSPAGVPNMAPNTTGNILAARIMATGQMQNAGGVAPRVFGRNIGSPPNGGGYNIGGGGGNPTYMTVLGFPGGTSYEIYSQTTINHALVGLPVQIY
ncbi:hypothetical protein [Polaromonas sp. UC242_47]|uniref:hypothetical protein n=1 Tax=Polaromonas sp. UC242_47 TaxID=3374626 RepID=UPI0037A7007C